jgi:ABC-2 type transport system permease protein
MQAFFALARRELAGFLLSMSGYAVMAAALFQMGLSFVILLARFNDGDPTPLPITELFFSTQFFWFILLLIPPIITMRLFAREKATGTYETLMTTPVGDGQIVLAKFSAALLFYVVVWLPLIACIFIVRHYANDAAPLDFGAIGGSFAGVTLMGALFISVGCLSSALTNSQVTAAITSFGLGLSLFIVSFLSDRLPMSRDWAVQALNYVAMNAHMEDFSRGVIDTRCLVYYTSATVFFLCLTHRVVESRRWR